MLHLRHAALALAAATLIAQVASARVRDAATQTSTPAPVPAPLFPPLPHPLFDVPLDMTGTFGDHRSNHIHAGFDLGTGGVVGRAVHAPANSEVRRVRASGVGYGRSVYLETADGRLLVFG